jgi:hypothetical protein
MRTLILLLALIAPTVFAATPEGAPCTRTEAIIENVMNLDLTVSDNARYTRMRSRLFTEACAAPVTENAVTVCADVNRTAAQECAVINTKLRIGFRATSGARAAAETQPTPETVNAAQNAAEADWD